MNLKFLKLLCIYTIYIHVQPDIDIIKALHVQV